MNRKVNLSKIKKCDQIWDDMDVCDGGRLCAACDNVIQDFRGLSGWDIALIHSRSETKVCGIYDKHQLGNTNQLKKVDLKKKLLFASAVGLLSVTSAYANTALSYLQLNPTAVHNNSNQPKVHNNHSRQSANRFTQLDSVKIVRGILSSESGGHAGHNNDPLAGCNIVIVGTDQGTISDVDGSFSLDVTEAIKGKDSIVLDITYVGYSKQRQTVLIEDFNNNEVFLNINLEENYEMEAFGVVRPKLHKRIWYGLKNIFRKRK